MKSDAEASGQGKACRDLDQNVSKGSSGHAPALARPSNYGAFQALGHACGFQDMLAQAAAMVFELYSCALERMESDVEFLIDFIAKHFAVGAVVIWGEERTPVRHPIGDVADNMPEAFERSHSMRLLPYLRTEIRVPERNRRRECHSGMKR